ncbi:MAG: outer membrane protein assembly factor BamD [Hyphomicrobium aestuarii]|nr:outer membrane protein assembly factor BamD [Hyphomicrobium aestuarii]
MSKQTVTTHIPSPRSASHRPSRARVAGVVLAFAVAALAGCASSNDLSKALNPDPPEKMFADADGMMSRGRFEDAAKKFEEIDRDHPYAPEARRATVLAAYANYKGGKLPEAIAGAERYTTLHSGTKEAALAQHIIASSYYEDIRGPQRDQGTTKKALAAYRTLKTRYPDSTYAKDADNRIRICEDTIAASEMEVGRYYIKKRQFPAAINRFKTVVTEYQTTAHVEEALMRLTEAYLSLGIANEAQNAAAVLGHNYPDSKWYRDAHGLLAAGGLAPREQDGSWLSRTWRSLPKFSLGGPG